MSTSPDTLFTKAYKADASDVHVAVGHPIIFRIHGELVPQGKSSITAAQADSFVRSVLGPSNYKRFKEDREIDVSRSVKGGLRLRINCHYERGNVGLAARIIPSKIPSIEEVGLTHLQHFCDVREGLILFTGPTGVGKSTTLAAMLEHINLNHGGNVVTLEDPIEFIFSQEGKGIVKQREFGTDFFSFPEALRRVMRQDPDIIMLGEMRDLETIAAALTLAETGHLIFATLHTPNAIQTIDRIVDVFPPYQQQQVRSQLSFSLRAVIAQKLLPAEEGGRIAQREVLVNTPAVSNIIRDNRVAELLSVLQTGKDEGMCTFEKDAKRLYKEGLIDKDVYQWTKEG